MGNKQIGYRYFLTMALLFLLFVGCFVIYQHHRERIYNIELLDVRLQGINHSIITATEEMAATDSTAHAIIPERPKTAIPQTDKYPEKLLREAEEASHVAERNNAGLRITLIATDGTVLYDTAGGDLSAYENHLQRKEVAEALATGKGYDLIRQSERLKEKYFYSATLADDMGVIVRCAVPYTNELVRMLRTGNNYLLFAGIITVLLILVFLHITRKVSRSVSEKENLLTHLRISREGLGVFDNKRKLILSNTLFNQYGNMISDTNLSSNEEILSIPEMAPIREFLDKELHSAHDEDEEPCVSYSVDKNGAVYMINSVVFHDGGFEISINDVTQQEAQSRLKHELTQNIAHELKTPVSSIQGYLEIILDSFNHEALPPEQLRYFLERCHTQSTRLTNLLQDISTLSRMGDTSRTVEKEAVDISQTVDYMLQEVALKIEQQHMTVENLLPHHLTVNGNQSMIYSIFRNLTDNAVAYAGEGTKITINCFNKDDKFYYFSFADNGTGVPEEHLGRIFERFYRVDKGRSRKLGGTGLGLAIVKNAVAVHSGNISVKNRPGGGLEFIFSLKIR